MTTLVGYYLAALGLAVLAMLAFLVCLIDERRGPRSLLVTGGLVVVTLALGVVPMGQLVAASL